MYATYSLADDKLRLYPEGERLDDATYASVRAAGLSWAPQQQWFGQVWSPAREDLLLELAGDIEDEDTTPQERAAARAERYERYSANAGERAQAAQVAAERIMDGIPLGQPILVGHHSQRHAERDAEKIRAGIRRAVDEMKATEYWRDRARGVLRHADYKLQPDVVARRIKGLEAEERKHAKERKQAEGLLTVWRKVTDDAPREMSMAIANYDDVSMPFPLAQYPRDHDTYEGNMSLWSALDRRIITAAQARDIAIPAHERMLAWHDRWLDHLANRLAYERALLEDAGGLVADQKPLEIGGAVRYRGTTWLEITKLHRSAGKVVSVTTKPDPRHAWLRKEIVPVTDIKGVLTQAEYAAADHAAQVALEAAPVYEEKQRPWEALQQAADSVQAVSAPELFPTPPAVIERMLDEVNIAALPSAPWRDGRYRVDVLEPSAGTGALVRAILQRWTNLAVRVECVEINYALACALGQAGFIVVPDGANSDFLDYKPGEHYGLILMNPPFSREVDHVQHAYLCLAVGGRLVAVMSEGPFFRERDAAFRVWLERVGGTSCALPDGSFLPATGVKTRLVVIDKR